MNGGKRRFSLNAHTPSPEQSTRSLTVQKYGGATLATPELVKAAARRILEQSHRGPLIVVVSAMGTTTNSLIQLAHQVAQRPARRELDMLLSVGERISMSLVSMAINELGGSAISFTGSQAGILTDDDHFNARIVDVRGHRVQDALKAGKIVILAGFQGVSPVTKEITTLGRGGSDVSAVAMAAAFGARRCEILKDVPAVFSADPRVVARAQPLAKLSYEELADMTFWGAKVLHYRSVELARRRDVSLYIGPVSSTDAEGTIVGQGARMYEIHRPLSINSHETVLELDLGAGDAGSRLSQFEAALASKEIAAPQILGWSGTASNRLLVTGPSETLMAIQEEFSAYVLKPLLSSVTMTCTGSVPASLCGRILSTLNEKEIEIRELRLGALSASIFLKQQDRTRAIAALHDLIPQGVEA